MIRINNRTKMKPIIDNYGILDSQQILDYKRMLIKSKLKQTFDLLSKKCGIKKYGLFNLEDIKIPDSILAKRAVEEALDNYSSTLLRHCYRSYYWAAGFALSEKLKVDSELLFVASILHDIALTDKHNHECSSQCFALYGGSYAQEFVLNIGAGKHKANQVKTAIDLHLNPIVERTKDGNEAYVLSKGAVMDVIGSNYFQLPTLFIIETHEIYTREGFKQDIIASMENLNHKKYTRANILYQMGFGKMANKNILDTERYNKR